MQKSPRDRATGLTHSFGLAPSGQALADRLAGALAERDLQDVQPAIDVPADELAPKPATAAAGSPTPESPAPPLPPPFAETHHVFGGVDWAIMGQVTLVEFPRLVAAFEADLDPFVERIKRIDRPHLRLVDTPDEGALLLDFASAMARQQFGRA